jgi:hypothetical protein
VVHAQINLTKVRRIGIRDGTDLSSLIIFHYGSSTQY